MAKTTLRGKDLIEIGYPQGKVVGLAIHAATHYGKKAAKEDVLAALAGVLANPEAHVQDPIMGKVAEALIKQSQKDKQFFELHPEPLPYPTYGAENIEPGAVKQMRTAMALPVTLAGALMPDAHEGYGLPIGGVLATHNAVIPYGVGMDIGCRMCLTVYDLSADFLEKERTRLRDILVENTRFGRESFPDPFDDEILARHEFKEISLLKGLGSLARQQIGTSGSGNHFVEFGLAEFTEAGQNPFGLPPGQYLAILSHSGSRKLGATIAQHYTKVAMETCKLPDYAKHLAWLDLDGEAGQEYWMAMNLAGDYASACHSHIHRRLAKALGETPIARVENHHNFAWKEHLSDGREVIVHRKGATPAGEGTLGIIPGSMTSPGFIVRGRGQADSLNSASHGAGRQMSRRKAKENIQFGELKQHLKQHRVDLVGGGLDEAPFAYKDINAVMACQQDLVDIIGRFTPRIVRMDSE